MKDLASILSAVKSGKLSVEEASTQLKGYDDLGHSRIDTLRAERNGAAEVVYGEGKTPEQIIEIMRSLQRQEANALVTKVTIEAASEIQFALPDVTYDPLSKIIRRFEYLPERIEGKIAVVCAGTSDLPVAEEARLTAEFFGNSVEKVYDAGVAGLHRLLDSLDTILACRVVIVVAGMEGALPSVVGGLVKVPVIAVPTSVGYGANFGGLSALLGMLNSCASGVSVVNIDNGFGAGFLANRINRL